MFCSTLGMVIDVPLVYRVDSQRCPGHYVSNWSAYSQGIPVPKHKYRYLGRACITSQASKRELS